MLYEVCSEVSTSSTVPQCTAVVNKFVSRVSSLGATANIETDAAVSWFNIWTLWDAAVSSGTQLVLNSAPGHILAHTAENKSENIFAQALVSNVRLVAAQTQFVRDAVEFAKEVIRQHHHNLSCNSSTRVAAANSNFTGSKWHVEPFSPTTNTTTSQQVQKQAAPNAAQTPAAVENGGFVKYFEYDKLYYGLPRRSGATVALEGSLILGDSLTDPTDAIAVYSADINVHRGLNEAIVRFKELQAMMSTSLPTLLNPNESTLRHSGTEDGQQTLQTTTTPLSCLIPTLAAIVYIDGFAIYITPRFSRHSVALPWRPVSPQSVPTTRFDENHKYVDSKISSQGNIEPGGHTRLYAEVNDVCVMYDTVVRRTATSTLSIAERVAAKVSRRQVLPGSANVQKGKSTTQYGAVYCSGAPQLQEVNIGKSTFVFFRQIGHLVSDVRSSSASTARRTLLSKLSKVLRADYEASSVKEQQVLEPDSSFEARLEQMQTVLRKSSFLIPYDSDSLTMWLRAWHLPVRDSLGTIFTDTGNSTPWMSQLCFVEAIARTAKTVVRRVSRALAVPTSKEALKFMMVYNGHMTVNNLDEDSQVLSWLTELLHSSYDTKLSNKCYDGAATHHDSSHSSGMHKRRDRAEPVTGSMEGIGTLVACIVIRLMYAATPAGDAFWRTIIAPCCFDKYGIPPAHTMQPAARSLQLFTALQYHTGITRQWSEIICANELSPKFIASWVDRFRQQQTPSVCTVKATMEHDISMHHLPFWRFALLCTGLPPHTRTSLGHHRILTQCYCAMFSLAVSMDRDLSAATKLDGARESRG
eukprot:Lankesteria_metandrocarpae@DN9617_c0_g1_i1.p1